MLQYWSFFTRGMMSFAKKAENTHMVKNTVITHVHSPSLMSHHTQNRDGGSSLTQTYFRFLGK